MQPSSVTRRSFLSSGAVGTASLSALAYDNVAGANDRVGVGVIGYGLIGKNHVGTFLKIPDAELVAVSDAHSGRRAEGRQAMGGTAEEFADFRKLLDSKRVQAVVVATPDHWHTLMSMLACAAGKDVYVEKPLTLFVREGEWLQAVAKRTGRVVQVGTQQRSGKHYQRARDLLRGGHIGTIHTVRVTAVRNVFPGFGNPPDQEPPAELDWDMWLGPAPARKYNPNRGIYHFRWFWDTSGGQMTNLGAHQLDIADWVLGLDTLRAVSAVGGRFVLTDNGETPDTQDVVFDLGRRTMTFTMRECSVGSPGGPGLEFFGTRGSMTVSRGGFRTFADPDTPAVNMIPGVREGHPVGGPKAAPVPKDRKARTEVIDDATGSSPDQYLQHARNFLDCIKSRQTPVSDLASAQRVSVACHLANLSLRLGRPLRWDGAKNDIVGDAEASGMLARPYRKPWDAELKALNVGSE